MISKARQRAEKTFLVLFLGGSYRLVLARLQESAAATYFSSVAPKRSKQGCRFCWLLAFDLIGLSHLRLIHPDFSICSIR